MMTIREIGYSQRGFEMSGLEMMLKILRESDEIFTKYSNDEGTIIVVFKKYLVFHFDESGKLTAIENSQ